MKSPLPVGEDTKPWRLRLGGVGEGFCLPDRTQPLTQLRLASKLASLRNPLPQERGLRPLCVQNGKPDHLQHIFCIRQYIFIPESDDAIARRLQRPGSRRVLLDLNIMLPAVQFDNQLGLDT